MSREVLAALTPVYELATYSPPEIRGLFTDWMGEIEREIAAYVKDRFAALGLADVTIDRAGNVRGRRPGAGGGPGVAVGAHLDTVFPKGTDVRVRRDGSRLLAPGIGDNSVAVAALLAMVEALRSHLRLAGVKPDEHR